jgi:oxalate decarboxylase
VKEETTMLTHDRRSFLSAATAGAGGLFAASTGFASEAAKPGDGGFGRDAVRLPPGDDVVHREPGEASGFPEFKYSLDGSTPKVTSGGWAKEATVRQFPVSRGIAGVHMYLDPGASRELHWHAIAAEWAFVIDGRCQTMVIDPTGQTEVNNFEPGDLWYFPKGHGHSIQTIGDKPCHFILSFDNGAFSENGTFSITDWVSLTPKDMLAQTFKVPPQTFDPFPKGETYIMAGPVPSDAATRDAPWPKESTHKFSLLRDPTAIRDFEGAKFRVASVHEFPASKTMTGAYMSLQPKAMKNLHWHPNANEWIYVLRGSGQAAIFGSGGRGSVFNCSQGDVAYFPAGYGHALRNTGDSDFETIQTWDASELQEIDLKDWMARSPRYLLANNFGVPSSTFDAFKW